MVSQVQRTAISAKTVIYARVSTDEQVGNFSIPTQLDACQRYAAEHNFEVTETYVDPGFSGSNLERPGLERLRDAIFSGQAQNVLVLDVDRISRRLVDLLTLDEEFRRNGTEIHYVQYPIDSSAEGFLFLQMRGAFAEHERMKIQERTRRGKLGRAKAGVPGWGSLPYGYRYVSLGRYKAEWQVIPEEAIVVHQMFDWLLDGTSVRRITRRLAEAEVKPKRGKAWGKTSVQRILKYEGYTGVAYWNKTKKVEPAHHIVSRPVRIKNKPVLRDRSEWIPIEVPQIIDSVTFEKAQDQLRFNRHMAKKAVPVPYLLTGYIWCICGRRMAGNKSHDRRYYRCTGRDSIRPDPCRLGSIRADSIELLVWDRIKDVLEHPETITTELAAETGRRKERRNRQSIELDVKKTVLSNLDRKKRQWMGAYEVQAIDLQEFKSLMDGFRRQEAELTSDIAEIKRRIVETDATDAILSGLAASVAQVNLRLDGAGFEQKRWALDALQIRITAIEKTDFEISGLIPVAESAFAGDCTATS